MEDYEDYDSQPLTEYEGQTERVEQIMDKFKANEARIDKIYLSRQLSITLSLIALSLLGQLLTGTYYLSIFSYALYAVYIASRFKNMHEINGRQFMLLSSGTMIILSPLFPIFGENILLFPGLTIFLTFALFYNIKN